MKFQIKIFRFSFINRVTSENFEYIPDENTSKLIWKYLSSNNLLEKVDDIDLENIEKIKS